MCQKGGSQNPSVTITQIQLDCVAPLLTDPPCASSTRPEIKFAQRQVIYSYHCFSKHRPFGPMLSISRSVRVYVCSLLRHRLTVFLPPLPEVGCPIFLEIWNPWGKIMERTGLRLQKFCS